MGNQIKFSPKKRDDSSTSDSGDYHTLEIENIQLKNTNRKLISKLNQQQQLIKNINSQMESLKDNQQLNACSKLKEAFQNLKNENKSLQDKLVLSIKQIKKLEKEIEDLNNDSTKDSKTSSPWNKLKKLKN